MPITPDEAWAATDPSLDDEQRKASAQAIMSGVAANDAYISSRGDLEQLLLRARGGQVVAHSDLTDDSEDNVGVGDSPTASVPQTVDSTATEDPQTPVLVVPEGTPTGSDIASESNAGSPSPDNPVAAVADLRAENNSLRQQLRDAGQEPKE